MSYFTLRRRQMWRACPCDPSGWCIHRHRRASRGSSLREVIPGLRRLAIMANVGNPAAALEIGEVQAAARTFDLAVATSQIRRDARPARAPRAAMR